LEEKVAALVEKAENMAIGICHADHMALSPPTSGGCSVGIVRLRTQAMEIGFNLDNSSAIEN
jgi:hypothetical protein